MERNFKGKIKKIAVWLVVITAAYFAFAAFVGEGKNFPERVQNFGASILQAGTRTFSYKGTLVAEVPLRENPPVEVSPCVFETLGKPSRSGVVFYEIWWMGDSESSNNERLSVKNISSEYVDVSGWQIIDKGEDIKIFFSSDMTLSPDKEMLYQKKNGAYIFTGNIRNENEALRLFDSSCALMDEVVADPKWPAGDNKEKLGMKRNTETLSWFTASSALNKPSDLGKETLKKTEVYKEDKTKVETKVIFSEVYPGSEKSAGDEFFSIFNPDDAEADLSGWSVKKVSSTGKESTLISVSRFSGVKIQSGGTIIFARNGADVPVVANIIWPASYSIAQAKNGLRIYDKNKNLRDEVFWEEIPKGKRYKVK